MVGRLVSKQPPWSADQLRRRSARNQDRANDKVGPFNQPVDRILGGVDRRQAGAEELVEFVEAGE